MMKNVLIVLFLCVVVALGQLRWTQRARVRDHTVFFTQVIQETIYEIERRGFSSLTLLNVTQNVDLQMYRWHVNGTANYTNGFLVSMQKLDVTGMAQSVLTPSIEGVQTPIASVSGALNMREVKLGYDVTFFQVNGLVHKFTGDFTHPFITWTIRIEKNLTTNEVSVSVTATSIGAGIIRMVYRPANNLTEVISRGFLPAHNSNGIRTWSTIIGPIVLDVIRNKIPFPNICYSHC